MIMVPKTDWVKLFENCSDVEVVEKETYGWRFQYSRFKAERTVGFFLYFRDVPSRLLWKKSKYKTVDVYYLLFGDSYKGLIFASKGNNYYSVSVKVGKKERMPLSQRVKYMVEVLRMLTRRYLDTKNVDVEELFEMILSVAYKLNRDIYLFEDHYNGIVSATLDFIEENIQDEHFRKVTLLRLLRIVSVKLGIVPLESVLKKFMNKCDKLFTPEKLKYICRMEPIKPDTGGDVEILTMVNEYYKRLRKEDKKKCIRRIFSEIIQKALEKNPNLDLDIVIDAMADAL